MRIVHLFALVSMIVSTCLAESTPTPRNRVIIHRDRGHVVAIVWMRDDKIEKVAGKLPEASSNNVTEKACDEKTYRSSLTQLAIREANPNRPALDVLASPTEKFELRGKFPTAERSIPADVEEQKQVHIFSRNPLEEFAIRNQADEERSLLALTVDRPQAPQEHHQHDLHQHELNPSDRDELDRLNSQMLSRRQTLRSNFAFDEFESAQRFRAKSDQAHRETVEGVHEKAEQTEREAKQVALALLPVIASQGLSASTSAASGVSSGVGAKTVHAVKSKMPASSPMDHGSPEASSKSQAGAFQMSLGAKRAADYLATLPQRQPPPNATHVTGKPVNADRLPLPWPRRNREMTEINRIVSDVESGRTKIAAGTPVIVGFPGVGVAAGMGRVARFFSRVRAGVGNTTPSGNVIHVTSQGVALPPGSKYAIPQRFVQNQHRPASYGTLDESTGKFVEKLRIDPATPRGKPGPERSHYHINGEDTHYGPKFFNDPGFPK